MGTKPPATVVGFTNVTLSGAKSAGKRFAFGSG